MKLFSLFILLLSLNSVAEVYTWINENGVRVYGDEPPADAKKAELPAIQKLKTLKIPEKKKNQVNSAEGEEDFSGYKEINILTPKQDAVITAGEANNISVQLHISPALQPKHEVTLLLDGKVVKTGALLSFQLDNISRGSHLLQAKVKYNGQLLVSSGHRRIHVKRPSILNRNNAR